MAVAQGGVDKEDVARWLSVGMVHFGHWNNGMMQYWTKGVMGSGTPTFQYSITQLCSDFRRLEIHVCSHPIVRRGGVALAGGVFGEKNVARMERHAATVPDTDLDAARQGDHPAPVGRAVVIDDMRREAVSEKQALRIARLVEELRCLARIERGKMRLAVVAGVEPIELHVSLRVTRCEII